jgi:creatinine amidohydrolase
VETALGLACFEHLVIRDPVTGRLAGDDGAICPSRFEAVNRGWVAISRPWHLLTTNSGAGNPHEATAEKGHRLLKVIVERLADFLVELDRSVIDESFPLTPRESSA